MEGPVDGQGAEPALAEFLHTGHGTRARLSFRFRSYIKILKKNTQKKTFKAYNQLSQCYLLPKTLRTTAGKKSSTRRFRSDDLWVSPLIRVERFVYEPNAIPSFARVLFDCLWNLKIINHTYTVTETISKLACRYAWKSMHVTSVKQCKTPEDPGQR